MVDKPLLREFWDTAATEAGTFPPPRFGDLPAAVQRYLGHAIAPGTPLANAVRLRMHGHIKLERWLPFKAEQVIRRDRGMIWKATARVSGISVSGYDRLVDGEGAMRWKLMGILPVMKASGPDITRSAAGRVIGESMWLPSMLCGDAVAWHEADSKRLSARVNVPPECADLNLEIGETGALRSIKLSRWGNPGDTPFHYADFGGEVEEEATFDGFTIPSRVRAGWHFGSDRFDSEGEFFRATIDHAEYR